MFKNNFDTFWTIIYLSVYIWISKIFFFFLSLLSLKINIYSIYHDSRRIVIGSTTLCRHSNFLKEKSRSKSREHVESSCVVLCCVVRWLSAGSCSGSKVMWCRPDQESSKLYLYQTERRSLYAITSSVKKPFPAAVKHSGYFCESVRPLDPSQLNI